MYKVITNYPVAWDSPDHTSPHGTALDNHTNEDFCDIMIHHFRDNHKINRICMADLGCSGGASVKSFLEKGHEAIGLEGSDYSLIHQRAEWSVIPNHLFTCDLSRPFMIVKFNEIRNRWEKAKFDLISAWEFFEHLNTTGLECLFHHIKEYLEPHGLLVASVPSHKDNLWHQTCEERPWWLEFAAKFGLINDEDIENCLFEREALVRAYGHREHIFVWKHKYL